MSFDTEPPNRNVLLRSLIFSVFICLLVYFIADALLNGLDPTENIENVPSASPRRCRCNTQTCDIFGWSSDGDVIARTNVDIVELDFLGLNRLDLPTDIHQDKNAENEFCKLLLKIGGVRWTIQQYNKHIHQLDYSWSRMDIHNIHESDVTKYMCWPRKGGVWITEIHLDTIKGTSTLPTESGRLRMCLTMEERCEMMKNQFDAIFYADPEDLPFLRLKNNHSISTIQN